MHVPPSPVSHTADVYLAAFVWPFSADEPKPAESEPLPCDPVGENGRKWAADAAWWRRYESLEVIEVIKEERDTEQSVCIVTHTQPGNNSSL